LSTTHKIIKVIVITKVVLKQWDGTKCALKIFLGIIPPYSHMDKNANCVERIKAS